MNYLEIAEPDIQVSTIITPFKDQVRIYYRDMIKYLNRVKNLNDKRINELKKK